MMAVRRLLSSSRVTGSDRVAAVIKQVDQSWGQRGVPTQNTDVVLQMLLSDVKERDTFRGVVATYMKQRQFRKVVAVFKCGPVECRGDRETLMAAATAYSELKTPIAAKQVLSGLERDAQKTPEIQMRTLEILLVGYSKVDRMDYVEGILFEWLSRHPEGRKLLEALDIQGKKIKVAQDLHAVVALGPDTTLPALPSAAAWTSVCKMYADRFAWGQCVKIKDLALHHHHRHLLLLSESSSRSGEADLGKIYHYTFRALCDANQFPRALALLEEMKIRYSKLGLPLRNVYLVTHLLKYYRFHDGGLEFRKEMLDLIYSGLEEAGVGGGGGGDATDTSDAGLSHQDGDSTSVGLSSAFVSLLCLRGRPEEAEEIARAGGVSGAVRPSALAMVINAYAKTGQWSKAEQLFWEMRDAGVFDKQLAAQAYHNVCDSMRRAKQLQSLALFVTRFSGHVVATQRD